MVVPLRILVVCTANQCRSPLTAVLLRSHAAERELPVEVASAGVQAVSGMPATAPTVDAARRLGADLVTHRSTPLASGAVRSANLVLGLERRHVQEIVLVDPRAFVKTFTLKELVRRGGDAGARRPDESVADWLAHLHRGRRPTDLLGASTDDDVTDPTGSDATDHHGTAEAIDRLASESLALLFP